jgi:hypothetical protein
MKTNKHNSIAQHLLIPLAGLAACGTNSAIAEDYATVVQSDNPVAYYRFEEALGESALFDSSASGIFGGTYISPDGIYPKLDRPGISTNSAFFHPYTDAGGIAQNPYAEVPYAVEMNPTGPFTAEAWVRATSASSTDHRSPVSAFGGWGDSSGWFFYQTPESGSGSSWVWVQLGGTIWVGGGPVTKFTWQHLVGAFDGTTIRFYVNGVLMGSANASAGLPNSGMGFRIGTRDTAYGFFDGNVDEVAIYGTALSADRIRLHYEVGLTNISNRPMSPEIVQDPQDPTGYAGRTVKFTVGTDGTAPLAYQWYKGNTPIAGATDDALSFVSSITDNNAQYKVVVTNLYGAITSAPATLTLSTELTLGSSPDSITRKVGSKAAFIATSGGALPVSYQWYKDASAIAGATNETLWLNDLKLSDDQSTYSVRISNAWNSTNSEAATLTVVEREVNVPATGYAKVILLDDPVAFWRLDEADASAVAVDAVGSFDGTYNPGNGTFTYEQTTGIPGETNLAVAVTGGARVAIPYALELNPHGPFTAEGWFKPTTLGADGSDYRTIFSSMDKDGPTGWLLYQQPNNTLAWVVFNDNWISSFIGDPITTLVADQWYHIALTYDGSLFHIYVNGVHTIEQPYDIFIPNRNGASNLGWRSDNDWRPFTGVMDDVAFYNKALTLDQVQAHYAATIRLSATKQADKLVLSWPFGTLQEAASVTGPYVDVSGATSPYTNTIGTASKFFRVKTN